MMGIKIVEIRTKRLIALLGKNETERFIKLSLYQGRAFKNTKG